MKEHKCMECDWEGYEDELITTTRTSINGTAVDDCECPSCGSEDLVGMHKPEEAS